MEVDRTIAAEPAAIFEVLADPAGHVSIDASGMLMSAEGDPASAVDDRFVVHMDRDSLRDFDLGLWSVHEVPPSLRPFYRGPALGEQMLRITRAAKITVNPHGDFMRWGGNMRLFEACGVGAFQIADDRPGIREWFTVGEHLITYRDPAHLRELVAYYLAHDDERARIAEAGRAHVHAHHTYDQRMARLLALVGEIRAGGNGNT